jgi:glucosamine-6-phosphate deaminase
MIRVERLPTSEAWADRVAERMVAALTAQPSLRVCLATGHTPLPVYERLVRAVHADQVSFGDAEVFLLDEFGGVPADADGRCDAMLRRGLLDHVDLPGSRYHLIDTDDPDVAKTSRDYEALSAGLDLTLLGIGANGHIGMNEPGSAADSVTRRVELSAETQQSAAGYFGGRHAPTWGITLGIGSILRSREIWLLATGPAKKSIVRRLLAEPVSPALPASFLHQHPNCVLFVDAAASHAT